MSTVAPRSTFGAAGEPSGPAAAWPEAVLRAVAGLARRYRPPAGSLRVLAGAEGAALVGPYLEARARVVGVAAQGDDPRFHVRLAADAHGLPQTHRADDADVVVLPYRGPHDAVPPMLSAVARALAAAGIGVLGLPLAEGPSGTPEHGFGALVVRAGLEVRHHERVRVEGLAWFDLWVVADPRPAPVLPAVLAGLDRTACVDRAQLLRALARAPWTGPGPERTAAGCAALVAALHQQAAQGEPNVRALPWPSLAAPRAPRDEPPGRDVLAIMPHPDDESVYAAGTLAGLRAAGFRVALVVATSGAGGRHAPALADAGGPRRAIASSPNLAARRAHELLQAATGLGLEGLRCLGWADFGKYRDAARTTPVTAGDSLRAWSIDRALGDLVAEIRRERPRVLLSLDPEIDPNLSLHGHHLGLGVLLAVAFHAAADPGFAPHRGRAWACDEHRVLAPQSHARWSDGFEIDREAKRRALRAHATQAYSTARLLAALDDPQHPAVELTRSLQARRSVPWWLVRAVQAPAVDAGIDWHAEANRVRARPRPRAALVELLRRQAGPGPRDAEVERSLALLAHDDAVTVVTGQQVGLLGGPAYTLAKALSAVALARRLRGQGVPAVPVFWLASQDHDLHEAQQVARLHGPTLGLGLPDTGAPVGPRMLGRGIAALCEQWAAELPDAHPEILALVRRTYRHDRDFTTAFVALLREAMRDTGLLLLDPSDPAFVSLAAPLLQRALEDAPAVAHALAMARERLRSAGRAEVVPTEHAGTLVFALDELGARRRVPSPAPARRHALALPPARLSPAALLRPVVQDAVLPTIAIVGGPTELRYLAQTDELYAWAGVPQPRALPRVTLQLARTRDVAVLDELGGLPALQRDTRPLARIGRAALAPAAVAVLDTTEAALACLAPASSLDVDALRPHLARLDRHMPTALPSLPRTARSWPRMSQALHERAAAVLGTAPPSRAITRLRHELHRLRRSLLRDGRRSRADAVAAWHRASTRPAPPERRMTVAELLARTSPALPGAVLAALQAALPPTLAIGIGGGA